MLLRPSSSAPSSQTLNQLLENMQLNPTELLPSLAFLGVVHVEVFIQSVMNPLLQSDAKGVEPSIGIERILFLKKTRGSSGGCRTFGS